MVSGDSPTTTRRVRVTIRRILPTMSHTANYVAYHRLHVTYRQLYVTYRRLHIVYHRLYVVYHQLYIMYRRLHVTYRRLHVAYRRLHVAYRRRSECREGGVLLVGSVRRLDVARHLHRGDLCDEVSMFVQQVGELLLPRLRRLLSHTTDTQPYALKPDPSSPV